VCGRGRIFWPGSARQSPSGHGRTAEIGCGASNLLQASLGQGAGHLLSSLRDPSTIARLPFALAHRHGISPRSPELTPQSFFVVRGPLRLAIFTPVLMINRSEIVPREGGSSLNDDYLWKYPAEHCGLLIQVSSFSLKPDTPTARASASPSGVDRHSATCLQWGL
jgi:hypothetical protein